MIHWISGFIGGILFLAAVLWWVLGEDDVQ
jgi:hypothetical protein